MATYQLMLREGKPKKDGTFPIIFKIYLGKKSKIMTLPFSCQLNEWDFKNKRLKKSHPKYKGINEKINKLGIRLQNAIDELEIQEINFDLDDILRTYKEESNIKRLKVISVSQLMLERVKSLEEEERFGYARAVKDTHTSLFKFAKRDLKFKEITPEFLDRYQHFLKTGSDKVSSNGGIAFRMRDIRRTYNIAMERGYANRDNYPFKTFKISKFKSQPRKIAINKEEFYAFKTFDVTQNPKYETTYKMFVFSYYVGGMNFIDMTSLKWSNVNLNEERLEYKRGKTKDNFNFTLREEAIEILQFFKENPQSENENYVFPIIHKHNLTGKQIYGRYQRSIKKFNKQLKFIADNVGISKNLTSYVSRHSFATHLKFNGVSETVIKELMGHSSEAVTRAYLEDFGNPVLDEAMKKLN